MRKKKKRKKSNEDLAFSEGIKIMKKDFKKMVDDMGDEEFIILVSILMHYAKNYDIFDDDYSDIFDSDEDFENDDYEDIFDEDYEDDDYEDIFDDSFEYEGYEDIWGEDEELEDNTKSSHRNSKHNNNIRKFPFNDEDLPF